MSGQMIGPCGVAPAASSITTVYADSTLSGDNAIGPSVSVRIGVLTGAATPAGSHQVRVTIKAGQNSAFGVQGLDCDHLSVGLSNGTMPDTTATPLELTGFDGTPGSHGCALHTASAQATSDFTTGTLSFVG